MIASVTDAPQRFQKKHPADFNTQKVLLLAFCSFLIWTYKLESKLTCRLPIYFPIFYQVWPFSFKSSCLQVLHWTSFLKNIAKAIGKKLWWISFSLSWRLWINSKDFIAVSFGWILSNFSGQLFLKHLWPNSLGEFLLGL